MEVKWTTKFEVEKAETEDQLSRRVEVARKKYIVESRADMIEELSEKIYNATEMPPRFRLNKRTKEPEAKAERPDKLERALEMRRRSSNLSIASMPELCRRVSKDVQQYLEGRRFSLQSALQARKKSTDDQVNQLQEYSYEQSNVLTQPDMRRAKSRPRRMSIQEDCVARLKRMNTEEGGSGKDGGRNHLPVQPPKCKMNKERLEALSCPRQALVLNVNNGTEFCKFTKSTLTHKQLRNIDRNHLSTVYNFSLDEYDKKMSMVDRRLNRARSTAGVTREGEEVASYLDKRMGRDRTGGRASEKAQLIEGMRRLEEAEYGYNIAKCHLWLSTTTVAGLIPPAQKRGGHSNAKLPQDEDAESDTDTTESSSQKDVRPVTVRAPRIN